MPRASTRSAHFGGSPEEVEAAFYEAMQQGHLEQLMACWADEDDIVCVHPGGPRLVGALAIRGNFEAMFANGPVRVFPERVRHVDTLACSVRNVLERVEVLTDQGPRDAWVIATNVYLKTAQGWRMVAHHASPGTASEVQESATSPVLH